MWVSKSDPEYPHLRGGRFPQTPRAQDPTKRTVCGPHPAWTPQKGGPMPARFNPPELLGNGAAGSERGDGWGRGDGFWGCMEGRETRAGSAQRGQAGLEPLHLYGEMGRAGATGVGGGMG